MPDSDHIAAIAAAFSAWDVLLRKEKSAVKVALAEPNGAKDAVKAVPAVGMVAVVAPAAEWVARAVDVSAAGSAKVLAAIWGAKASHAVAS
ncbi:hypothetical protein GCM10007872_12610 [Gluconobacter sphaericus NBRC 12467]|uniref:Uncharacterized protein n=1 Tax=Gluconobacter sphaericus NBRC 12467 TaxID=1307951 RepID=A0AA37WAZ0_9PROT|nr:hypothetical protein AA12467_0286 [Gluconobacter sphaericus NBRC 12467]GEB41691.1 hypothetical protein GSP01_04730 [Gluconobacter sphaericus NBRC 12467]GLQ84353.1 hypothetical protein GCM10007872_12610 [Gluconobacter sphaericus NBRC 12467]